MIFKHLPGRALHCYVNGPDECAFSVDDHGRGYFCWVSEAYAILVPEIPDIRQLERDRIPWAVQRIEDVEGDWTFPVSLATFPTAELWMIYQADRTADKEAALPNYAARRKQLNEILAGVIKDAVAA